jgi:hypothetical protein
VAIFAYSESPDPHEQALAWTAALVLISFVLIASVVARTLSARSRRRLTGGKLGRKPMASRLVCQRRAEKAVQAITPGEHEDDCVSGRRRVTSSIKAPTAAAQGMVMIQASTMFPATPQRTAESRREAPAPMTEPEIVCVVETGKPKCAVVQRIEAQAVWAAKPLRWIELRDPRPERLDDPPAAGVGAGAHRERRAHDHPERAGRRPAPDARRPRARAR